MYSPKIPEHLIPHLYKLGRVQRRPMTHLVADAVRSYLEAEGVVADASKPEAGPRSAA